MTKVPDDLKYAKSHEWVRLEGNVATLGITDHAQHELTDVVFVELPAKGRDLKAGDACAVVESVKTASDVYSPVSGKVVEINQAVADDPGLVNADPYGQGWFCKIQMTDPSNLTHLLNAADYGKQVNS